MIHEFITGHTYMYSGTTHLLSWNKVMDVVLDNKPRKCKRGNGSDAMFSDVGDGKYMFDYAEDMDSWSEVFGNMKINRDGTYLIKEVV